MGNGLALGTIICEFEWCVELFYLVWWSFSCDKWLTEVPQGSHSRPIHQVWLFDNLINKYAPGRCFNLTMGSCPIGGSSSWRTMPTISTRAPSAKNPTMKSFLRTLQHLRQLINQRIAESGSDPNAIQRGFLSNTRTNGSDRLIFRHVIFEVCSCCHPYHNIMVLTCWIHRNLTRMSRILHQSFYFSRLNDINIQYLPPKKNLDSCRLASTQPRSTQSKTYLTLTELFLCPPTISNWAKNTVRLSQAPSFV